jgi:NAD(P)-dependent dehydrogenase (short-subunit alcohol dehydrogenase family)
MDLKLDGKTAVVTGGSAGIGKGIARALAREGVDVAICARRKEPLEQTAAEIARETNRRIVPIPADLSKDADAKNFVAQAHKTLGRIDIMVNNAGSSPGGVLEHLSEADWEQSLQLKFMGYVRCLRYVLPIMVKQGGGRVVNLIGNDGVKPSYWEIAPGAANAAGQNLTLSLAGQYGKHNISFCAVNPGRGDVARYETASRGGRQACSGLDPAGPHRRGRGGRKSRGHAGFAAHAHGQRHPDRDRRRAGEIADGSTARPQVSPQPHSRAMGNPLAERNAGSRIPFRSIRGTSCQVLAPLRDQATLTSFAPGSLLGRT